ncbi:MAG: hypothetical protein HZA14_07600 [Nitrospirae bacterium]|nr:hypothetical protein [Nitrospirota bacterium]
MNGIKVLKAQVVNELEKLKKLLAEAGDSIKRKESNINVRAGGSILHDFYTGVENIFHAIASIVDERIPSGISWHIELLNQMTLNLEGLRTPVISKETAKMLEEYLRFRHLFRKRYGFELDWNNIKKLLRKLKQVYNALERDLKAALESET